MHQKSAGPCDGQLANRMHQGHRGQLKVLRVEPRTHRDHQDAHGIPGSPVVSHQSSQYEQRSGRCMAAHPEQICTWLMHGNAGRLHA